MTKQFTSMTSTPTNTPTTTPTATPATTPTATYATTPTTTPATTTPTTTSTTTSTTTRTTTTPATPATLATPNTQHFNKTAKLLQEHNNKEHHMRKTINFNDNWLFSKPGQEPTPVTLPHTWNAIDGQDGGNDYYRGTGVYTKTFEFPITTCTCPENTCQENSCPENSCPENTCPTNTCPENNSIWLEFNGAAMSAEVFLNDTKICSHQGGYSTFRAEITKYLKKGQNQLKVIVDNSDNNTVYPQKADFTFYGGLYRDVNLIIVPQEHFELGYFGTPGIKVTPIVDLKTGTATVTVETYHNAQSVEITVNNQTQRVENTATFTIENAHLWDGLNDPFLYTATARLDSGDQVSTRFGCRVFEIDPQRGFILNGRPYPLRGVSRHQDLLGKGNALTLADHQTDMAIIRELGANTLRLAHYQHAQAFYDLCDENGLVVWAEIPYITMHMPAGQPNTISQMTELITQNYNHPSIAVWGLSNEITAASQVNEDLLNNHRQLNSLCHRLDPTRKTTMANVFMLDIDSPILEIPDVNSYNLYFGWYLGELEQNDEFFDEYHAKYPDRCIGFSEYGADANPAFQSSHPEKGDYTESYQALYHEHMLALIEKRPWLWATHVWNLFDFAADGRDEGGKHGQNQKGIVTFDRKTRKDAFYLYKAAWNHTTPFVHLCGSRYVDRSESVTEVKVYSNQPEVTLYLDDHFFAKQFGHTIFTFKVPISGSHKLTAIASDCTDTIHINKVSNPNLSYTLSGKAPVTNWFDNNPIDPTCFSVNDKLSDLQSHPQTASIVNQMMAQGAQSRGDVADVVKDNPGLIRMMGRMSLISLLKQGGADPESIKQLNRILQTIKKGD